MKIKIPPYPKYKIAKQAVDNVISTNSPIMKADASNLSSSIGIIIENLSGEKVLLRAQPVDHQGKRFISFFPNPVHLFLNAAVENYNYAENVKNTNFPKCGKELGGKLYILEAEQDGTHDCYNRYIAYRSISIIMLVSCLEAFMNQIIPNDFIYKGIRKDKEVLFKKKDIEREVSFIDKLTKVIPQWLERDDFWEENSQIKTPLIELYNNRRNIIHLKTDSQSDLTRYSDAISKMLDFDVWSAIRATIAFINLISSNCVEFEIPSHLNSR